MTLRLLEMASLGGNGPDRGSPEDVPGTSKRFRAIDLGAGDGEAVRLLRETGYDAVGLDLEPGGPDGFVVRGNMLDPPFEEETFDLALTECALFASGDQEAAIGAAARLLKPGGILAAGDVFFSDRESVASLLAGQGLAVLALEDITGEWRRYYIDAVWEGSLDPCDVTAFLKSGRPSGFQRDARKLGTGQLTGKTCRYYLVAARKTGQDC